MLEKDTDEYKRIMQYVKNTHAPTHDQYVIEVIDVSLLFKNFGVY